MSTVLDPIVEMPAPSMPETWEESHRKKVLDAAAVLDEHKPGWYYKVSTETLDMGSIDNCVLGQVFRPRLFPRWRSSGWGRGLDYLEGKGFLRTSAFCSREDHKNWVNEIERRKNS